MAWEIVRNTVSIKATSSLATKQFCWVKLDSNGQIVLGTSGAACIGILQDAPLAADPGSVALVGNISKVLCGGSFNAGDLVMCGANGLCVKAVSGSHVLGQALSAGVSTFIADVLIQSVAGIQTT